VLKKLEDIRSEFNKAQTGGKQVVARGSDVLADVPVSSRQPRMPVEM